MSDDVKPALTAEEWAKVDAFTDHGLHRSLLADGLNVEYAPSWFRGIAERSASDPHARAALALHGQPFGFTREDVAFLRYHAKYARELHGALIAEAFDFDTLADRIAALLPPEPTDG